MRIRSSARRSSARSRNPITAIVLVSLIAMALSGKGFSQPEPATSRLKNPVIYQIGNVLHIRAEAPRSLLRVLDALQEQYGWTVNYEDPQYPAGADADANPAPLPQRRSPRARNYVRGGFTAVVDVTPTPNGPQNGRPDENAVLTAMVNAYNQGDAGSQFELRRQKDGRFDVVGMLDASQNSDESGGARQEPILDLPISLETQRRTANQTLMAICQELTEQSKIAITAALIDANSTRQGMGNVVVTVGGNLAPARTLLAQTLASIGERLSWRLLYDSASKSYRLEVTAPVP